MNSKTVRRRNSLLVTSVCAASLGGVVGMPAQASAADLTQWHLEAMHAKEIWATSTGEGITIAVIDTGVNAALPDLQGRVLEGENFSGLAGSAHDDPANHGTRIAELIAGTGRGNAGRGAFGLAPGTKILPVRVADGRRARNERIAQGDFSASVSKAIRYASDSSARIINVSMGQRGYSHQLADAVQYAISKGKLVFASVGNSGDQGNVVEYPAAMPGVVGVAAVDKGIKATKESQRGPQVDLAAPGEGMVTMCANGANVCTSHGTSDATALASASAALLWSVHPDWTANQITRVLINTAGGPENGDKRSDSIGYGVVRPRIALKNPGDPGPADVNPLPGPNSASPAPEATASRATGGMPPRSAADDGDGLFSTRNVLAVGVAAAVAAAVATAVGLKRRRRSRQM